MAQTFSSSQLRAARALLDWTRAKLAEVSGVSEPTIQRMETGAVQPHGKSVSNIIRAFDNYGVEFIANIGVQWAQHQVRTLVGVSGFAQFYEIVYSHLSQYGGEVCVSGVDESLFAKYQKNQAEYVIKVTKLMKERGDIRAFILTREGDENFVASGYAEYRWQPQQNFSPTAFYVFGDHLALISFHSDNPPHVVLITSAAFAAAYRKQFKDDFSRARIPYKKGLRK